MGSSKNGTNSSSAVDTAAMGIGLGLFGLAAGGVCGLSIADGASTSLLTTMFTFVSGAILSYSAFKVPMVIRAKAKEKAKAEKTTKQKHKTKPADDTGGGKVESDGGAEADDANDDAPENTNVARVGVGVGTFSVGLVIGVILGMWIRYDNPFHFAQHPANKEAATEPGKGDKDAKGGKTESKKARDEEGDDADAVHEIGLHNRPIPKHVCERLKNRVSRDDKGHSWYEQQADPKTALDAAIRDVAELEGYACEP